VNKSLALAVCSMVETLFKDAGISPDNYRVDVPGKDVTYEDDRSYWIVWVDDDSGDPRSPWRVSYSTPASHYRVCVASDTEDAARLLRYVAVEMSDLEDEGESEEAA
jgi:hypothetical protein